MPTLTEMITLTETTRAEEVIEQPSKPENLSKYLYISRNTLQRVKQICKLPEHDASAWTERVFTGYKIPVRNALNTTEENYVKNADSGEFWINGRDQKLKLGKLIKQLWGRLDSTEIETAVTNWKAVYTVDTTTVKVSSDIGEVYDISSVGGSCMAGHGEWMAIYEELGCKVAYLLDADDRLRARAILWDNNVYQDNNKNKVVTILDRIFFQKENDKITLERWAQEKGYLTTFTTDTRTCKGVGSGFDGVPYIDNMYTVIKSEVGNEYQLSNGYGDEYDTLQSTAGNSECNCGISDYDNEDYVWCEDIEEDRHIDDVYWNNTHESYYAYDDNLVYMDDGYYHCEDDRLEHTEDEGWCWREECTLAYDNDCWYSSTNHLIYCDDIEEYVTEGAAHLVEDLDEWHYETDGLYEDNTGHYWSDEEAYIEANGEDDE